MDADDSGYEASQSQYAHHANGRGLKRKRNDDMPPLPIRGNKRLKRTSKASRAYSKGWQTGPPIIPSLIFRRICDYVSRIKIRKMQLFLNMACRYWSLKREARRGAPLLKRLHLEVSTDDRRKLHGDSPDLCKRLALDGCRQQ